MDLIIIAAWSALCIAAGVMLDRYMVKTKPELWEKWAKEIKAKTGG